MAGLCGTIGKSSTEIDRVMDGLIYHGEEDYSVFETNNVSIAYVDHPIQFSNQPIEVEEDIFVWIWGTVIGHESEGTYSKRGDGTTLFEYCKQLYDEYGRGFPSGLNSEFSGIILNRKEDNISIFTDRLGSRPVYYTKTEEGDLLFSSLLQSLSNHPDVTLDYDRNYLSEFFTYNRALGIYTPFKEVKLLPPASITSFDLNGNQLESQTYWSPRITTADRPYSEFVDQFISTLAKAVRERGSSIEGRDGLLLSGGSDSRAILAAYDGDITTFHMNELEDNHEAQIAKKVANTTGAEFQFLQRDPDYHNKVLENCSNLMNYNGLYHSAKAIGFNKEINEVVDRLFCGQYSDTIIGETYVPMKTDNTSQNISSIDEYVTEFEKGSMGGYLGNLEFVKSIPTAQSVFRFNMTKENGAIQSHGIRYPSWKSLVEFGSIYPITNVRTLINYETLIQMIPTEYPYFDNRVIDLILKMPSDYRYGESIIADTVYELNPQLAAIPHAGTGLPLTKKPNLIDKIKQNKYINHLANTPVKQLPGDFLDHIGLIENQRVFETHISSGSWVNKAGIIRAHPFVKNKFDEHDDILNNSEFIDEEAAWDTYQKHLAGENHSYELFCLLTYLEITSNVTSKDATY